MIFFLKCVGKQRGYVEYEKAKSGKGSVKMKIVPATAENVWKQNKEKTAAVEKDSSLTSNVIPLFKKAEES